MEARTSSHRRRAQQHVHLVVQHHVGTSSWEMQERGKKELDGLSYAQDQLHSAVVQQTTRLVAPLTAAGARCSDS